MHQIFYHIKYIKDEEQYKKYNNICLITCKIGLKLYSNPCTFQTTDYLLTGTNTMLIQLASQATQSIKKHVNYQLFSSKSIMTYGMHF